MDISMGGSVKTSETTAASRIMENVTQVLERKKKARITSCLHSFPPD